MAKIVPDSLIPAAPVLNVNDGHEAFTIHEDFVIEAAIVDKPWCGRDGYPTGPRK